MPQESIHIRGAREHNLKNVNVSIPREQLVVITGVSGSGKSSLAFDTIYAEGQRRYFESLSSYARQFLGSLDKPDVDDIIGLSPAISIDQKGVSKNPRSTVGTVTEVYDYLRLLFARVGKPHCPYCGDPVAQQTVQQIVDSIAALPEESRVTLMAPKIRRHRGEHKEVFETVKTKGFARVRVNGDVMPIEDTAELELDRNKWHYIEIVVDRLIIRPDLDRNRLTESVETALREGDGVVMLSLPEQDDLTFSEEFSCNKCNTGFSEIEPRTFSFNSPHGACPFCTGLGYEMAVDVDLVIPDRSRTLRDGALAPWNRNSQFDWYLSTMEALGEAKGFTLDTPVKDLTAEQLDAVLYGTGFETIRVRYSGRRGSDYAWNTTYEGIITHLRRRYRDTNSESAKADVERFMSQDECWSCHGNRLRPEALSVLIAGSSIMDVCNLTIGRCIDWLRSVSPEGYAGPAFTDGARYHDELGSWLLERSTVPGDAVNGAGHSGKNGSAPEDVRLAERDWMIGEQIIREIMGRLNFLDRIGLDYISLNRAARTLSGGEAQRVRLATQIGSGLTGVLYVCDEPTVGLHPHDDHRLINTLTQLRDMGNTVVVVEHDEAMMRAADHIVDMGPGAGENGGNVMAQGTVGEIMSSEASLTGAYLSGRRSIPVPEARRPGNDLSLTVRGARANNLRSIDVDIPLGLLCTVTGVSGSGKSTLVYDVLYKRLAQAVNRGRERPGEHDGVDGIENIDKVVNIDQSPIGRTPRSNPATYTGAFTPIREVFAGLPESRIRGYKPGRFSFNVKGGRCEACQGDGYVHIEMQFLSDITLPCQECRGGRYNREALEVNLRGHTIADVLAMTVDSALEVFHNYNRIRSRLETLRDVGLGYIRLGQPATTLSGGEAQRVKLATELSKRATGKTLYLLDEPTTGLSFEDCAALLRVLHRLVDQGNSVVLIEHNVDIIRNSDWLIDLGPGAGDRGGELIATGTPEQLMDDERSLTGRYINLRREPALA